MFHFLILYVHIKSFWYNSLSLCKNQSETPGTFPSGPYGPARIASAMQDGDLCHPSPVDVAVLPMDLALEKDETHFCRCFSRGVWWREAGWQHSKGAVQAPGSYCCRHQTRQGTALFLQLWTTCASYKQVWEVLTWPSVKSCHWLHSQHQAIEF